MCQTFEGLDIQKNSLLLRQDIQIAYLSIFTSSLDKFWGSASD